MARSIIGTPSRRRMSRVAALLAAPAAVIGLLSGCGAGQEAQTARMVAPVAGNEANSKPHGQAALRDVQIRYNNPQGYPVGATAPLSLYIANNNPLKPLVLRGVTAVSKKGGAKLGSVVLMGGAPDIGVGAGGPSVPVTSPSLSVVPSSVAPGQRASAAPSVAATPSAAGAPASLTIPPNGYARLTVEARAYLAITSIAEPLQPGSSALVTFTFEGEDPLEIPVPFGVPLSPPPRAPVVPSVTAPR
ncbi:MAG: hypothetical protein JWP76_5864 [Dactylosporangium sp.]|nr:hypothetical protein [Dactylosporangium sp.]